MRYVVFGLSASALLLALSGCGQSDALPAASEVSPVSATAAPAPTAPPAATTTDAATAPPATAIPAPTSTNQPIAPTSLPALAQTALAQALPQATPDGKLVTVRGQITGLDSQTSTLSIGTQQIVWNDQTQIFALTKRLPVSLLRIGRTVTAQVRKNEQGQLVAERIVLQPFILPHVGPPPG